MCVCVRVRIQRPDDVLEFCPTILTEDSMQAQHLGATLALYNLAKGQVGGTAKKKKRKNPILIQNPYLLVFLSSFLFSVCPSAPPASVPGRLVGVA